MHEGLVFHPLFAFRLRHLLDGVAEHSAGHFVGVLAEEIAKEIYGASFTHLSEHPSNRFMHQVVRMVEMDFSIAQAP